MGGRERDTHTEVFKGIESTFGFPGVKKGPSWLSVKNPPANAGDAGSIPGSYRSPGEGNGYPLQYSCLENPRDRGAWRATKSIGPQTVGHYWSK